MDKKPMPFGKDKVGKKPMTPFGKKAAPGGKPPPFPPKKMAKGGRVKGC